MAQEKLNSWYGIDHQFVPNPSTLSKASGLLFALLCGSALTFIHSASGEVVRGVFSLAPSGNIAREPVLANPNVDGISIRQDWKDLEPAEGAYDWTFLDSEVGRAAAAGKQVLLRINTQANKPAWVTSAVTDAGGTFVTFESDGIQTTIPVFWDPTFLAKKKAMIAALGAHFAAMLRSRLSARVLPMPAVKTGACRIRRRMSPIGLPSATPRKKCSTRASKSLTPRWRLFQINKLPSRWRETATRETSAISIPTRTTLLATPSSPPARRGPVA